MRNAGRGARGVREDGGSCCPGGLGALLASCGGGGRTSSSSRRRRRGGGRDGTCVRLLRSTQSHRSRRGTGGRARVPRKSGGPPRARRWRRSSSTTILGARVPRNASDDSSTRCQSRLLLIVGRDGWVRRAELLLLLRCDGASSGALHAGDGGAGECCWWSEEGRGGSRGGRGLRDGKGGAVGEGRGEEGGVEG